MNKKIVFAMIIALSLCLSACATVTEKRVQYPDGSILLSTTIELDSGKFVYTGYTAGEVLEVLDAIFSAMGRTVEIDADNYSVCGYIVFDSLSQYYEYYGINSGEQIINAENLFFDIYERTSDSTFKNAKAKVEAIIDGHKDLPLIKNYYNDIINMEYETLCFIYIYGTPYKSVSSNADDVVHDRETAIYLHYWNFNDYENDIIVLKIRQPNVSVWLTGIIIAGIVSVLLFFVFAKLMRKKANG